MKRIVSGPIICLFIVAFVGCNRQPTPTTPTANAGERVFDTRGVVRDIASSRRKAVIHHEEIPGYMPRMVMELAVRETNELAGIAISDEITFRLHATADTHWIDTIRRVGLAKPDAGVFQPALHPQSRARTETRRLRARSGVTQRDRAPCALIGFSRPGAGFHVLFHTLPVARLLPAHEQELQRGARASPQAAELAH